MNFWGDIGRAWLKEEGLMFGKDLDHIRDTKKVPNFQKCPRWRSAPYECFLVCCQVCLCVSFSVLTISPQTNQWIFLKIFYMDRFWLLKVINFRKIPSDAIATKISMLLLLYLTLLFIYFQGHAIYLWGLKYVKMQYLREIVMLGNSANLAEFCAPEMLHSL